jgi:mannosyltransferase OCH1-like enzyme
MIDIKEYYTEQPIDRSRVIPNQLFQTWKTSIFDNEHAALLKKFRDYNSETSFKFYDDSLMHSYMEDCWGTHPIFKVFSNTNVGAAKADIWRYCILFDQGGAYLDIDSLILFKLTDIPSDFSELLSCESNSLSKQLNVKEYPQYVDIFSSEVAAQKIRYPNNIFLNWAMMFSKGHPVLKNAIDFISFNAEMFEGRIQKNMLNAVLHFSGPLVLTYAVRKCLAEGGAINQLGIDFDGGAIFKAYIGGVYAESKHYSNMNNEILYQY